MRKIDLDELEKKVREVKLKSDDYRYEILTMIRELKWYRSVFPNAMERARELAEISKESGEG